MLMLIMENWNLDLLSVFSLAIRMVLKSTSCSALRPVRLLLAEMLFLMKLLCYEICLLMFLVKQVSKN